MEQNKREVKHGPLLFQQPKDKGRIKAKEAKTVTKHRTIESTHLPVIELDIGLFVCTTAGPGVFGGSVVVAVRIVSTPSPRKQRDREKPD